MRKKKSKSEKRKLQRRRAERLHSHIYISYREIGKDAPWKSVAYKDISGVGISLLVNEPLKVSCLLDIAIYIKGDAKSSMAVGKVVRCRKMQKNIHEAGVEFEKEKTDERLFEMLCEKIVDLSLDRREE